MTANEPTLILWWSVVLVALMALVLVICLGAND